MTKPRKRAATVAATEKRTERMRKSDPSYLRWRTAREKAQAELKQLELDRLRREVMPVSAHEAHIEDLLTRLAAQINRLVPRLAPVVMGCKSIADAQKRIAAVVDEIRDDLQHSRDDPAGWSENAPRTGGRRG